MASRGFKGDEIGIHSLVISGSMAKVEIQFRDSETMVVHATMQHSIPLAGEEVDDDIETTARAFLTALRNHITRKHYTEPEVGTPIEEVARGIQESLRGEADEPA